MEESLGCSVATSKVGLVHWMRFDPSRDNVESVVDEDTHTALRAKMAAGVRTSTMYF